MRKPMFVLALFFGWASAVAHGDFAPKHGGFMSRGGEVSFEVVPAADGFIVHVEDHGEPIPTKGATGTVRVANEPGRQTVLLPDGGNRFKVEGLRLRPGQRLVFVVQFPDGTGGGAFADVPG